MAHAEPSVRGGWYLERRQVIADPMAMIRRRLSVLFVGSGESALGFLLAYVTMRSFMIELTVWWVACRSSGDVSVAKMLSGAF